MESLGKPAARVVKRAVGPTPKSTPDRETKSDEKQSAVSRSQKPGSSSKPEQTNGDVRTNAANKPSRYSSEGTHAI